MDRYNIVKSFLHAIEKLDLEKILKFFDSGAQVESPVLGRKGASPFYKEIVEGTESFKFTIEEIFQSQDKPLHWCVLFRNQWAMKNGEQVSTDVIMWLTFAINEEKITSLKTFYHSFEAQEAWAKVHK